MSSFEFGDIATWAGAAVAVAAIAVSLRTSRQADRIQQETAALTKKNAALLEKQHQLELRSWTQQYFASVRVWADQVCCAISEAILIVDLPNADEDRKFDVLVRLSSLLDTGRWYFPNQRSEEIGTKKHAAYRGLRQPVLDCVFEAYDSLRNDNNSQRLEDLVSAQRKFVSLIQEVLDPRAHEREIKKVLREFEVSEQVRKS